ARAGGRGGWRSRHPPGTHDATASRCHCATSACPPGVDHVHVAEPGRRTAVAHGVRLAGLSLAVEEAAVQAIAAASSDHVHGVPEVRRADLVRHVLQHARYAAVADLVEELPAELRVVALLVN